jgi:hypothetical protein
MAVEDKFVNALTAAGKLASPHATGGAQLLCLVGSFEQAAADSNGSVYRLARLPANAIPVKAEIFADASIDGTDYDLGLYKPGVGGAVVDKDIFADGLDLASGEPISAPLDGLANLGGADPIAALGKNLWELLGLTKPARGEYDLALTANVAGGAAGTIGWRLWYAIG